MIIHNEDIYNDTYGRERMYLALQQRYEEGKSDIPVPSEGTVRKIMEKIGIIHKPRRKANGITKADSEAHKSDDLLKRNFKAYKPLEKAITDISELKAKNGKVYVSAIFDYFDRNYSLPHIICPINNESRASKAATPALAAVEVKDLSIRKSFAPCSDRNVPMTLLFILTIRRSRSA